MKQNSGDNRCIAIVTAMATNQPPELFEKWCNHKPPYSEIEMAQYLALNGYAINFGLDENYFYKKINVADSLNKEDELVFQNFYLSPEHTFTLTFQLKDFPAIFIVKGKYGTHAIYWDKEKVYDPDPNTPDGRDLNSYHILKYFPIFTIKKRTNNETLG